MPVLLTVTDPKSGKSQYLSEAVDKSPKYGALTFLFRAFN